MSDSELFATLNKAEEMSLANWRVYRGLYNGEIKKLQAHIDYQDEQIEELKATLRKIADEAFSSQDDDVIWMNDNTPLGQFIEIELACFALAGEKKE